MYYCKTNVNKVQLYRSAKQKKKSLFLKSNYRINKQKLNNKTKKIQIIYSKFKK